MADKTIVIRLAVRAGNFTQGLNQAGGAVNKFAVDVSRGAERASSSTMALGAASAFAGKAMLLGIGGAMAVSAQAAIEFESSMAGVAKTVDFTGSAFANAADPINEYALALRSLSLRTPINVNELAKISEVGGQLGIQAGNLVEFTETMAALGVSTNLSAEEAASGLARFANIMGTSQDDFDVLGSIVVRLGNNLATTESEILSFGTRLAAIGQTINASEADILALGAGLSSLGIPAERGGTAVQRVFIEMKKAIDSGSARLEVFADTAGVTGEEFADMFAESPGKAFEQFVRGLDNITESGKDVFAVLDQLDLDSVRTTQVLLAAAGGADVLARALEMAGDEAVEVNALWEESARRYGTTESEIQLVANAFNDLRIEIGDLLLGTGGLVAAMEFLKELFAIIKDNLDTLGSFAEGLAMLTGLKLILWLGTATTKAFKFVAGLSAATKGAKLLGVAAATVNLATLAAALAAGVLAVAWGNAAREAAEMRGVARDIQEAMEGGATASEAMIGALENQTAKSTGFGPWFEKPVLNDEWLNSMRRLTGYSKDQFFDAMLKNVDILKEIGYEGNKVSQWIQKYVTDQGKLGDVSFMAQTTQDILNLTKLIPEVERFVDGFRNNRAMSLADAMLEAGWRAGKTSEQFDAIIQKILDVRGLTSTVDGKGLLESWMDPNGDYAYRLKNQMKILEDALKGPPGHWRKEFPGEEGDKVLEDHFDSLLDIAEDYRDRVSEVMEEAAEAIMGSFPAWDEYEQEVIENLDAVAKAQKLYLTDMTDWTAFRATLSQASAGVLEFLDNLPPEKQGALARYAFGSPEEWAADLQMLEDNFGAAHGLIMEQLVQRLPEATRAAVLELQAAVGGVFSQLGLSEASQEVQAFVDSLKFTMANAGITESLETLILTDSVFRNALFNILGVDLATSLIQGFIARLIDADDEIRGSLEGVSDEVEKSWSNKWQSNSPSKVTMGWGKNLADGLQIGLERYMPTAFAPLTAPIQSMDLPSTPIVNVNNPPASRSATVQIHNPTTRDLDRDLAYAATVAGLMSEVGG